jgi:hypothetical protein
MRFDLARHGPSGPRGSELARAKAAGILESADVAVTRNDLKGLVAPLTRFLFPSLRGAARRPDRRIADNSVELAGNLFAPASVDGKALGELQVVTAHHVHRVDSGNG